MLEGPSTAEFHSSAAWGFSFLIYLVGALLPLLMLWHLSPPGAMSSLALHRDTVWQNEVGPCLGSTSLRPLPATAGMV